MAIWDFIRKIKKSEPPPPVFPKIFNNEIEEVEELPLIRELAYLEFASINLCIDYIARNVAILPFKLVRKSSREEIKNTNLNKLLRRPNELYSFEELLEQTVKEYLIYGIAIWDKGGIKPLYLNLLNSKDFTIEFSDRLIERVSYKGTEMVLDHLVKFLSYSPLGSVFSSKLDSVLKLLEYERNSITRIVEEDKTFGAPRLMLSVDGLTNEEQARAAKVNILNQMKARPGIPIVIGRQVEVRNLSAEQKRNITTEREGILKEIYSTLLGVPNIGSYSNTELLELSIFLNTIVPIAKFIQGRINYDLVYFVDKGLEFKFELKETEHYRKILSEFARAEATLVQNGILSRNEVRRILDLPVSQELSDFLLATSLVEKTKTEETRIEVDKIVKLLIDPLKNSEKLEDYFKGKLSFQQIKKYYTTLVDIPAITPFLEEKLGKPEAEKFINEFKQKFLELLVSSGGKFEFIGNLEEWLRERLS